MTQIPTGLNQQNIRVPDDELIIPQGPPPGAATASAIQGVGERVMDIGEALGRARQRNQITKLRTDALEAVSEAERAAAEAEPGDQEEAFNRALQPFEQSIGRLDDPVVQEEAESYLERRRVSRMPEIQAIEASKLSVQGENERARHGDAMLQQGAISGEVSDREALSSFETTLDEQVEAGLLDRQQKPEAIRAFRSRYYATKLNTLAHDAPDAAEELLESPEARTALSDAQVRTFRGVVSAGRTRIHDERVDRVEIAAIEGNRQAFEQAEATLPENLSTDHQKRVARARQMLDGAQKQDAALGQVASMALTGDMNRIHDLSGTERDAALRMADDMVRHQVSELNQGLPEAALRQRQELARLQMRKLNNAFPEPLKRQIEAGAQVSGLDLVDPNASDALAQYRGRLGDKSVQGFETYRQLKPGFRHFLTSNIEDDARSFYDFADQALKFGRASDSREALALAAQIRGRAERSGREPFSSMERSEFEAAFDDLRHSIADVSWLPTGEEEIKNEQDARDRLYAQASFIQELTGAGPDEAIEESVDRLSNDFVVANGYAIDLSDQNLPPALGEDQSDAARRQALEGVTQFVAERYANRFGEEDGVSADDLVLRPDPETDGLWTLTDMRLAGGNPVERSRENPQSGEAPEMTLPLTVMSNSELARWIDRMESERRQEAVEDAGEGGTPARPRARQEALEAGASMRTGIGRVIEEGEGLGDRFWRQLIDLDQQAAGMRDRLTDNASEYISGVAEREQTEGERRRMLIKLRRQQEPREEFPTRPGTLDFLEGLFFGGPESFE